MDTDCEIIQQRHEFDWIKGPNDEPVMRVLQVACLTATDHNRLCSSSNAEFGVACHTGLRVYDGSVALAEFIMTRGCRFLSGKRVLELGCGCGLSGLAAMHFPCESVHFTDGQPACLDLVKQSLHVNFPSLAETVARQPHQLGVQWETAAIGTAADARCSARASAMSWDDPAAVEAVVRDHGPFDVILAAEICYFFVDLTSLMAAVKLLLEPTSGVAIFCHVNRVTDGQQKLIDAARNAGLTAVWIPSTVIPTPMQRIESWVVAPNEEAVWTWLRKLQVGPAASHQLLVNDHPHRRESADPEDEELALLNVQLDIGGS